MKANTDCKLLVISDKRCTAKIGDFSAKYSSEKKLLGIKLDSNLSFENHVTSLYEKKARNYTLLQKYHITLT